MAHSLKKDKVLHPLLQPIVVSPTKIDKANVNAKTASRLNREVRAQCKLGLLKQAFYILHHSQGIRLDSSTYASLLQSCINKKALPEAKLVHAHIIHTGFECQDIFLGNKLVTMYTKFGPLTDARRVLDEMPERNVISWTAMISAYTRYGYAEEALALFYRMKQSGVQPNEFTFASVLPGCAKLAALEQGKEIHEEIMKSGFESDLFVVSALVDMYVNCGSIEDARQVFDKMPERDVVSWNAMITGYAQSGHINEAWKLFQEMPQRDIVTWNAMIAGYAQNGHVDEAREMFQKTPERDVVSWSSLIAGYTQNRLFDEAMELFREMRQTAVKVNSDTFASILTACANMSALNHGKELHEDIIGSGFQFDVFVASALVDMYAKCGVIEDACKMFDRMPRRNEVSWNAMIVGYAMHGYGKETLQLFEQMKHSSSKPDHITFIGVLSACCHAGLVDDGQQYFDYMIQCYGIRPVMEHYCCMVDLFGRAGNLDEAQNFINKMPIKPNSSVWGSLLGACRIHGNIDLGEHAAKQLFELDPGNATPYVLLSSIYAETGRWDGFQNIRKTMKDKMVKKNPGCSWIEVNKQVYAFHAGD